MRKYLSVGLVVAFLQFLLPINLLTQPPPFSKAVESELGFILGVIVSPQGKSGQESLQVQVPPNTRTLVVNLTNLTDPTKDAENVIVTVRLPNGKIVGTESNENQSRAKAGLRQFPQLPQLGKLYLERKEKRKEIRKEDFPVPLSPGETFFVSDQEDVLLEKKAKTELKKIESQKMMGDIYFPKKRAQNKGLAYMMIHGPMPGNWTINVEAVGNPTPFQVSVMAIPNNKPSSKPKMERVGKALARVENKIRQDFPQYSPWGCNDCCKCKNFLRTLWGIHFLADLWALATTGGPGYIGSMFMKLGEAYWGLYFIFWFHMGVWQFIGTVADWLLSTDFGSFLFGFDKFICKLVGIC